ncbi:hypothetical protein [Sphingosinicella sp. BN140058]|uniref:hypothetical protein n=1 Tax=Sphingosinicella sp. BN140058 TaxID=1892855 RepID=UPI0010100F4E|nr:hypothetical protein [Sphingosinicella sp. BN140058]QAY80235.1 hypothetical protein ETR14_26695 [Sphingosinicella sp. BN140058]
MIAATHTVPADCAAAGLPAAATAADTYAPVLSYDEYLLDLALDEFAGDEPEYSATTIARMFGLPASKVDADVTATMKAMCRA